MKILSVAPTRISLFGGGTDVEPFVSEFGGLVVNMAINIYQHISLFDMGDTNCPEFDEIPHSCDPEFYYSILEEFFKDIPRFKAEFDGHIESGLGSSASCAVALVGAINHRLNLKMTNKQIAEKAWDIEVKKIGLYGGKQDQYASTFGGANIMTFSKTSVTVDPIDSKVIEQLQPYLSLFYLGFNRESTDIQEGFKDLTDSQINHLWKIKDIADEGVHQLKIGNVQRIGELLAKSWSHKKLSNTGVSNTKIDKIYNKACDLGAVGGKLLGSGGGGHILFFTPLVSKKRMIKGLKDLGLEHIEFSVCYNGLQVKEID